jgi:hypothetical protein
LTLASISGIGIIHDQLSLILPLQTLHIQYQCTTLQHGGSTVTTSHQPAIPPTHFAPQPRTLQYHIPAPCHHPSPVNAPCCSFHTTPCQKLTVNPSCALHRHHYNAPTRQITTNQLRQTTSTTSTDRSTPNTQVHSHPPQRRSALHAASKPTTVLRKARQIEECGTRRMGGDMRGCLMRGGNPMMGRTIGKEKGRDVRGRKIMARVDSTCCSIRMR